MGQRGGGAGDGQLAVLQGLAEDGKHFALELGQFVQEEDAVVRQAHLAGAVNGAGGGDGDRSAATTGRASGEGEW
jgi:hypothetical protein